MYKPSEHQAAGHKGCLTDEEGTLFIKKTAQQEIDFYNALREFDLKAMQDEEGPGPEIALLEFMPRCMGVLQAGDLTQGQAATDDKPYIVLQNLYHGYTCPLVLDIKLGAKLTDDAVTDPEKIERLGKVSAATTSGSHNFRVCGMKVYNNDSDAQPEGMVAGLEDTVQVVETDGHKYLEYNKMYGRGLNRDTVARGIELFFEPLYRTANPKAGALVVYRLVQLFLERLQLLYNTMLDYETRMFSVLVLFTYEGDLARWQVPELGSLPPTHLLVDDERYREHNPVLPAMMEADDEDDDTEEPAPLSQLNLIDFAHSKLTPGQGHDDNVITGVENLIKIFEQLAADAQLRL